jgi:hypothetical protein
MNINLEEIYNSLNVRNISDKEYNLTENEINKS